jgi:hypothetical protein
MLVRLRSARYFLQPLRILVSIEPSASVPLVGRTVSADIYGVRATVPRPEDGPFSTKGRERKLAGNW